VYLSLQTNIHMPIKTKNQKEEARAALLRKLELPKSTRAIVVSYIQDERINTWLKGALSALGVVLMTQVDEESIAGADIWITDVLSENIPQSLLCQNRVVGVVPRISNETALYSEFDPMKFTGNAFIFDSVNEFLMFEKLIRALENMRYAGDKRMLLQNVEATKV